MTIATLAKLLVINIVARRVFGFLMCFKTCLDDLDLELFNSSKSEGERLKKATSEPDIRAEQSNKIIINKSATPTPNVKGLNTARSCPISDNELEGSKFIGFRDT